MKFIPKNIFKARERRRKSQGEVARAIGLEGHGSVSRYESGKTSPSIKNLKKIADYLEVDLSEFFIFDNGEPPQGVVVPNNILKFLPDYPYFLQTASHALKRKNYNLFMEIVSASYKEVIEMVNREKKDSAQKNI